MSKKINWINLHNQVRYKFNLINPKLWWGDDLDVRFYILNKLLKLKNKKILDIGCNVGVSLSFLDKSNKIYGIDINKNFITQAKKYCPNAHLIESNMNKLPFESKSFDVIIMMNVMPYYDFKLDKEIKNKFINDVFDEVNRVLRIDGTIYLSTPNGNSPHYKNKKIKIEELKNILNKYSYSLMLRGWNNIFSERYFFLSKFFIPKIFYRYNLVWTFLIKNMNSKINTSKYFYIEAKNKK